MVNCDYVTTVFRSDVGRLIGHLRDDQEPALADALVAAFDLEV